MANINFHPIPYKPLKQATKGFVSGISASDKLAEKAMWQNQKWQRKNLFKRSK